MGQGDKYKTNHTEHRDTDDAPKYMDDFLNIDALISGEKEPDIPDTSIDAVIKTVMEEGGLVPDKALRDSMMERYKEYYDQNYYDPAAERALKKLQREEKKAARREGRTPDSKLWEDSYKKEFEKDYFEKKQTQAAKKALVKMQKEEEKAAESEARPKNDILGNKKYQKKFIANYLANQERIRTDSAADSALSLSAREYLDSTTDTQLKSAVADKQKEAENTYRMYEALAFMTNTDFEYLTRGATLACTCGAVWRRLNLPNSHGIFYGKEEDPVINLKDDQVGDAYNITNFGLCAGSNPPDNWVELEDMVFTDEMGRFISTREGDTVKRGNGCVPEIVEPGWQNPYKKTQMGEIEMNAVSTRSFLVCMHGGIIYPINSGQHSSLVSIKEDDAELNSTFDQLCTEYRSLQKEAAEIRSRTMGISHDEWSGIYSKEAACMKKIESCMDRARGDGYQNGYYDIPPKRRDTMNHMLEEYTKLAHGENAEIPSLKSDYYSYRRRNGFTSDSDYYKDDPGFRAGSDSYTDWRAGRLENMGKKEAAAEFRAWEDDVNSRGYDRVTKYEKEEFDKAKKQYGK